MITVKNRDLREIKEKDKSYVIMKTASFGNLLKLQKLFYSVLAIQLLIRNWVLVIKPISWAVLECFHANSSIYIITSYCCKF